ncbi:VOC family protein [Altererythrobacter arenosus]|uniref:VOC family protein n=1 Tax=Altererythrobacter arenosus TaxID=3032592 RepID=A0ABY8FSC4_9SPHN|nr:VOC family protein [Altererythrobacter sp. CAU 1644]WFL76321.1 VOC family protein [Altererythrobacter sp. CAU 1644]
MNEASGDLWSQAEPFDLPVIDHVGLVVSDIEATVDELRRTGLKVSDPEPLLTSAGPLGQRSAHCVFENGYLEISAPNPGSGNHLEPFLAMGEGWKILVFACDDCEQGRDRLQAAGIACGPVSDAARTVLLSRGSETARFRWFSLSDMVEGVLVAYVEHRDREIVFAPELTEHSNGARKLGAVLFGASARPLECLGRATQAFAPHSRITPSPGVAIPGVEIVGADPFVLKYPGWQLRAVAAAGGGQGQ